MIEPKVDAWLCSVCGYVHRESRAPEQCPVCGAPKTRFDPYEENIQKQKVVHDQWQCLVCNYTHAGELPPEKCPVCGTAGNKFEAVETGDEKTHAALEKEMEIVIVGGGIAGVSAAESARQTSKAARITLLAKEPFIPYYRLNLTRMLAGELDQDQLSIYPEDWFKKRDIQLVCGFDVSAVDIENRQVALSDHSVFHFDKLILAAGAHPFMPPIPGIHLKGVTALRNLKDANRIKKHAGEKSAVVIVGGGILGLEVAAALKKKNAQVTVIEGFDRLMPRQLNQKAAGRLEKMVTSIGIDLKTGMSVKSIEGDEKVAGVLLDSGETLGADMVIVTAGVRPNSYLARLSGLHVNNGVVVDDHMRTSAKDIFAAGDITEHRGMVYGLWNAAQYQGAIAGMNAAGKQTEFGGIPRSNSIKVLDADLLSIGMFEPEDASYLVLEDDTPDDYICFVFRDTHLVGAILLGDTRIGGPLKKSIEDRTDFSGLLKQKPKAKDIWNFFT